MHHIRTRTRAIVRETKSIVHLARRADERKFSHNLHPASTALWWRAGDLHQHSLPLLLAQTQVTVQDNAAAAAAAAAATAGNNDAQTQEKLRKLRLDLSQGSFRMVLACKVPCC